MCLDVLNLSIGIIWSALCMLFGACIIIIYEKMIKKRNLSEVPASVALYSIILGVAGVALGLALSRMGC